MNAQNIANEFLEQNNITQDDINNIRNDINSPDFKIANAAKDKARTIVSELSKLILYQELDFYTNLKYMDWINKFSDGYVKFGNTKEYIKYIHTGSKSFNSAEFIPSTATKTLELTEVELINIYGAGGVLDTTSNAYQFLKPRTIQESEWLPYFKSSTLTEFIDSLYKEMYENYTITIFDKIVKHITSSTPQKSIVGKAINLFDAMNSEFLPELRKMTRLNTEFNYSTSSKANNASNMDDIVILMNSKTIQNLQSGIKSQLFTPSFFDFEKVLTNNIYDCGNQLTIGDENTPISISSTPYVDENTIWVIDTKGLKHIKQINETVSQYFIQNLSLQVNLNIWGAFKILKWCKIFKYTNNKLNVTLVK